MADSYILTVEKALTDHIATKTAYQTYRGRVRMGRNDPLPMIGLLQAADIDEVFQEAGQGLKRADAKVYLIQGWAIDDRDNPTDPAHELLANVKQALSELVVTESPNYMLKAYNVESGKPLIGDVKISTGLVRPPDMGISDTAYFWLPIRVTLLENIATPYALP